MAPRNAVSRAICHTFIDRKDLYAVSRMGFNAQAGRRMIYHCKRIYGMYVYVYVRVLCPDTVLETTKDKIIIIYIDDSMRRRTRDRSRGRESREIKNACVGPDQV